MSNPTIESNIGTIECSRYFPGHNVHWIPVLKRWVNEPRLPMTIRHIEGNLFEITSEGKTERLYNHDPKAVIKAIEKADPSRFKKVGETGAITIETDRGHAWIYFGTDSFMECQIPKTTYYERFRNIDQEITRLEAILESKKTEWDIKNTTKFLDRAKLIKQLQLTNAHQTMWATSLHQNVCSCGLILDGARRMDSQVGHTDY